MHEEYSALIGIAVSLAMGAASPGPSFVMVARTAASSSRLNALYAALGMGCGGFIFAMLALMGLIAVLAAVPALYLAMKVLGGVYLGYLGIKIWKNAQTHLNMVESTSVPTRSQRRKYFGSGLATQLSNPKTAIVYASVFAAFLPQTSSLQFKLTVMFLVFVIETSWYSLVATMLSAQRPRRQYLRFKIWIDRLAGGILLMLGARLVISSQK